MIRRPLCDPFERQWRWLLEYGTDREKALVGQLYAEPTIRVFCPYPVSNEIHLSRNTAYPWDDEGLPIVVAETDGSYSVRSSDGSSNARGTVADVAASLVAVLESVPRPRRSDGRQTDLADACEQEWRRMVTSSDRQVMLVAERLFEEPEARRHYPYASMHALRLSRNDEHPWDDEGLPRLVGDGEGTYIVVDGEGEAPGEGDLAAVVAVLVRLLGDIRTSTRDFQNATREALQRGAGGGELLEIVRRYKGLGLGQREAYDALAALRPGHADPVEDLLVDVLDIVTGWCSPQARLWDTQLTL